MTSQFAKFHRRLAEVRKGTEFLNQDIENLDKRLLQSFFLSEANKRAIREEIVKNTAQSLHFLREYITVCGRLEQNGKPLLPAGKANIKLTCENGSNYERVPPMNIRDIMRMEVFKLNEGILVAYGRKSLESIWFKLRSKDKTLLGPDFVAPGEAYAAISEFREKLSGRMDLPQAEREERAADLARMEEILRETQKIKGGLLSAMDPAAKSRSDRLIEKIEKEVEGIKEAYRADAKGVLEEFKAVLDSPMPFAANRDWPLTQGQAQIIAQVIATHGGRKEIDALGQFIESYSQELDRNTVPAPLQPQLSEFLRLAKIASLYTIAKVSTYSEADGGKASTEQLSLRLQEINQCISNISRHAESLEALNRKFDSGRLAADRPVDGFSAVWEMGSRRKAIWQELETLKNALNMLCTKKKDEQGGRDEYDRLAVMIPVTAAQNFTRVTQAEAELWRGLLEKCRPLLRRYLAEDSRNIEHGVERFAAKARAGRAHQQKAGKRGLKDIVGEHEERILALLESLEKADPMRKKAIYEIFNDTKSHLLYKMGGAQILCPRLEFHLTPERLLIESREGGELLARLTALNSELFGLFDKYRMSDVVLAHLDRFNHFEPNAMDSNPDYGKLVTSRSQGRDLELPYRHYVEPVDGADRVNVTINTARVGHSTYLPDAAPDYSPDQFDARTIDEILYGSKQPLPDYLSSISSACPRASASAKCAYDAVASAYIGNSGDFLHIRAMLEDRNTYEFLASFALKQRMLNGAVFIPKKGEIGYNDPLRLDGENGLMQAAGLDAEKIEYYCGRVEWYLKLTPARIMLHAAHSRKWEWAMECASRIAGL